MQKKIVIVGGSAAGLRCACRLARLKPRWKITVVESRDTFSYAACGLPYALSGDIGEADALRKTDSGLTRDAGYFSGHKGIEVLAGHRAVAVDTKERNLTVAGEGGRRSIPWDELVLATGATPRMIPDQPEHPRVRPFHVWEDMAGMHEMLARGEIESVALIGGGLVGCELAEAFASMWGAKVTLLESEPSLLPAVLDPAVSACVQKHLADNGVEVLTESPVERLVANDDHVTVATAGGKLLASIAVVAVGVDPAVELARLAGAEIGQCGGIVVDEWFSTSVANLWAIGDCAELRHAVTGQPCLMPLGSLANREGRTLANILAGRTDAFPPVAGAVAVRVFDWNVAAVGCTARKAASSGFNPRSIWLSSHDRPHYWPEAKRIHLALTYDADSGQVLGVQGAGEGEIVKRIDVATQLISRNATVEEFAHIEHAYAPPYSPALDPLAVAAFAAMNQEDGTEAIDPLSDIEDYTVLDVRLPEEVEEAPAACNPSKTVPVGDLRDRIGDIGKDTDLAICEQGTRSAEAVRILSDSGNLIRYLGGGLKWRAAAGMEDR